MADKFGRVYLLQVQKRDGTFLNVQLPFTVEFEIHRNSLSSASAGSIRIYNLNPDNRAQIRKDQYAPLDLRQVALIAGYGNQPTSLAFAGHISHAWSVREGCDYITQIESFDGGFAYLNASTNTPFPAGTPQQAIVDSLATFLSRYGVSKGAIGSFEGEIARGNSFSGPTTEVLTQQTGGAFFIDNNKVNCLKDNECLAGDIPIINSASGLLGTPTREGQFISLDMLFEPNLRVGQLVRLDSATTDNRQFFNGYHKVLSLRHRGTISATVCGSATTTVGLLPGAFFPVQSGAA